MNQKLKPITIKAEGYVIELKPLFDSNGIKTDSFLRTISSRKDGRLFVIVVVEENKTANGVGMFFEY